MINGGMDFTQPQNSGGGFLNKLLGGIGSYKQAKDKLELQKSLIDYRHNKDLEKINLQHDNAKNLASHKTALGLAKDVVGITETANAQRNAYIQALGTEKGAAVHGQHLELAGMEPTGALGPIAGIKRSEIVTGRSAQTPKTETEDLTGNDTNGVQPAYSEYEHLTTPVTGRNEGLNVGMGEGKE